MNWHVGIFDDYKRFIDGELVIMTVNMELIMGDFFIHMIFFFGFQEEYTIGDEVGRLHCEHAYHLKCVQEWLRMKSWCPICKTPAETSSSK